MCSHGKFLSPRLQNSSLEPEKEQKLHSGLVPPPLDEASLPRALRWEYETIRVCHRRAPSLSAHVNRELGRALCVSSWLWILRHLRELLPPYPISSSSYNNRLNEKLLLRGDRGRYLKTLKCKKKKNVLSTHREPLYHCPSLKVQKTRLDRKCPGSLMWAAVAPAVGLWRVAG